MGLRSSDAINWRRSVAIFCTISLGVLGVPAGASRPIQRVELKPGSTVSAKVGRLGKELTRRAWAK